MGSCPNELNPTLVGLMIRLGSGKGGKEGVMDIDHRTSNLL